MLGRRRTGSQADIVSDVLKLGGADLFKSLTPLLKLLVDLHGLLDHFVVGILGPSHHRKVGPGRDPLVTVRIQPESEKHAFLEFLLGRRFGHGHQPSAELAKIKPLKHFENR